MSITLSLQNSDTTADNSNCKDQCAPSAQGCLRCGTVPAVEAPAKTSALIFGPRDGDAAAALRQALKGSEFDCISYGPLFVVSNVGERLSAFASLIGARLSPYTQSCIQTIYTPTGLETLDQLLSAISQARPLAEIICNIDHQWVRSALNDNWLFSVFHPIIDARTGEVFAYEALLRAKDPRNNKIIGAGPIIQSCEKLNLMHQLDQRARQCAIGAAARHLPGGARVFINFLPNTIYDPEICLRTTMKAAAENNVSLDRLVFEVVETEKIPDMAHLCKVLNYYRERGVGTAIDDMGAGYTSIDYIMNLKANFVKLDREFVLSALQDSSIRLTMQTIINTSHAGNARVIAEGIETTEQMSLCVDAGIDFLQGFLFAKPACPPQAVDFPASYRRAA